MKNTTIVISLLSGILFNNQIVTYSEVAALTPERTAAKKTKVEELINQCDSAKTRGDYGAIISAISSANYWNGTKISSAFQRLSSDLKAKLCCHLVVALNNTDNDFSKVINVMKNLKYYDEKSGLTALGISTDCKIVLCSNLMSALIRKGSAEQAIELARSAGYWNGTDVISPLFQKVEAEHKAELVNNLACALIAVGKASAVPELMRSACYYTGETGAPIGFKNISGKYKAALCTTLASALNTNGKSTEVLSLMQSAGYWNRMNFPPKNWKDIQYEYKTALVEQFKIALEKTGQQRLVLALEKAAGIRQ